MRIAIPLANGRLAMHFGHCEEFSLIDVDPEKKEILNKQIVEAPAHEPGLLPRWLAENEAEIIISGGMGMRAQSLFSQQNISVVVGAPSEDPEAIVAEILGGAGRDVRAQVDRRAAIAEAIGGARAGDVVVIAGKGHEQGQEFKGGHKIPFDDATVAREVLRSAALAR